MSPTTFTADDVLAELAARGTAPSVVAIAAGVPRHVLEAAVGGDVDALSVEQIGRVGRTLGLGSRVLEVPVAPVESPPDSLRAVEAARLVVADEDRARVHDPDAPWLRAARAAGVDVAAAFGAAA